MKLKGLVDEDIANYKKTSMFLIFPFCSFKCDKENCNQICQNGSLANEPIIEITKEALCERYLSNPMSSSIVCGGLEPFDSKLDLLPFIDSLRNKYHCNDDIVIYTGYTEDELKKGYRSDDGINSVNQNLYESLISYSNIIIKYGRFIPDQPSHLDEILGVNLASPNQYAKIYNYEEQNENYN